jgi:hypothetical protein
MAYRTIPIYNLDGTVGKGGENRPDDVRLLEALISSAIKLASWDEWKQAAKSLSLPEPKPVSLTSVYSKNLEHWILIMQKVISYGITNPDGIVHPLPGKLRNGDLKLKTKAGKNYTLWNIMDLVFQSLPDDYMKIMDRTGVPLKADC